jgi:hypothetical protein
MGVNMESEILNRVRMYTEDKNIETVLQMLDKQLTGYTYYRAEGVYNKKHEKTVVFEFISDLPIGLIYEIAEDIKDIGQQETVLVTVESVQAIYI